MKSVYRTIINNQIINTSIKKEIKYNDDTIKNNKLILLFLDKTIQLLAI